jgi:hypothetical protein
MRVRICVNHRGKTVFLPLIPSKYGKFIGFLKNFYLRELGVPEEAVREIFRNLDNLVFTNGGIGNDPRDLE